MISTGKVHGGAVRHIARKGEADKSLCGRWVLMITANRGTERMCKTCARISGSEVITVTEAVHPDDRDAVHVLETVAASVSERHAMRVRALPGTVKRINAEWFATMRVMLTANAKRRPVNVLADLEKSRDWAFATLVINAANRGEIITGKVEKAKPVEFIMNTAPTESDEIVNGSPVMPTANRGGGDGMVNPNSKSVAKPKRGCGASEKQIVLIKNLISQIREINSEAADILETVYTDEWLTETEWKKISAGIDALFAAKRSEENKAREIQVKEIKSAREWRRNQVYVIDGVYHRVHISQSTGRPYTQSWNEGEWVYQGMKFLKACTDATACTAEQAKAWAHEHDSCVFCHKPLDDQRSRNAGYGSTCADNNGLPWGE